MSGEAGWRTGTDSTDYLLHQKKRLELADRRPVIRRTADVVGPGIAKEGAVRIDDFNDILATFNGFFSAAENTENAPTAAAFVGWVASDAELGGVQLFTTIGGTNRSFRRTFRRNPADPNTIYWTLWKEIESV